MDAKGSSCVRTYIILRLYFKSFVSARRQPSRLTFERIRPPQLAGQEDGLLAARPAFPALMQALYALIMQQAQSSAPNPS